MKINEIVSEFTKVQKEFQGKAQNAMKEAFTIFFKENPRIKEVYWTQYTPYFNDGETCYFSVNEMYAITDETTEDDEGEWIEERAGTFSAGGRWKDEEFNTKYAGEIANFTAFQKEIGQMPDDVYELTFGDHVEVHATRKGFDVEEYEHE